MGDGTKDTAQKNLGRLVREFTVDTNRDEATQAKMKGNMSSALGEMGKMVNGDDSKYSKTMQMTAAGVFAQLGDNVNLSVEGSSNASRDLGSNVYKIMGRGDVESNDTLGTTLHEMTHVASGMVYDNTNIFFTIGQDATEEEIQSRKNDRAKRLNKIAALGEQSFGEMGKTLTNPNAGSLRVNDWIPRRRNYALRGDTYAEDPMIGKTVYKYIPEFKGKMVKRVQEAVALDRMARDGRTEGEGLPQYNQAQLKKLGETQFDSTIDSLDSTPGIRPELGGDIKKNAVGIRKMEAALAGEDGIDSDALVEYDPVINQILSQYEEGNSDRSSAFYRNLKAAVLRSHVDRQQELLKKQMRSR